MIVDRIEGQLAVVEVSKGKMIDVPISAIRGRVRDGAVLVKGDDGSYVVDETETARRMKQASARLHALFNKSRSRPMK